MILIAGEDAKSSIKNSHSLQMGMEKDTVTLDDSLEVSYTTKHSYHTIVLPHIQLYYHTIHQAYSWHTSSYLPN